MSLRKNTTPPASLALLAAALLACALLAGGCNKGGGRSAQAPGTPPQPAAGAVQAASIPEDLVRQLPLDAAWEIKTFSEDDSAFYITAQPSSGAMETAGFLLKWLSENGYDNADNPSRILEGSEFSGGHKRFKRLYVKSSLDADSKVIVNLTAYK